jgi:hypothetical protein
MANRLFIVGCFAHDSQGILAAVGQFTLMGIERHFNFLLRFDLELRVTTVTNAHHWSGLAYDSQLALWHDLSLAQVGEGA